MKPLSVVSVLATLAVLLLLIGPVFATPPPPGTVRSPIIAVPVETIPIHHAVHSTGPIVVKWPFRNHPGFANLIVNPDGTYLFSGIYKQKPGGYVFTVNITLKSSLGGFVVFHYHGGASPRVQWQWSQQGKSAFLKDQFKTFNKYDWGGSYRLYQTAAAREAHLDECAALEDPTGKGTIPMWTDGKHVYYGYSPQEIALLKSQGCY